MRKGVLPLFLMLAVLVGLANSVREDARDVRETSTRSEHRKNGAISPVQRRKGNHSPRSLGTAAEVRARIPALRQENSGRCP